jgi:hypothetical protein
MFLECGWVPSCHAANGLQAMRVVLGARMLAAPPLTLEVNSRSASMFSLSSWGFWLHLYLPLSSLATCVARRLQLLAGIGVEFTQTPRDQLSHHVDPLFPHLLCHWFHLPECGRCSDVRLSPVHR